MAVARWIPLTVAVILSSILVIGVESVDIPNLRFARNNGTNGRFVVPRPFLEGELERLGLTGKVHLLSSSLYNSEFEGEVSVFIQTIADITLHQELPPELVDYVPLFETFVTLALPVVASDGSHSTILLSYFTDTPIPFVYPHLTSIQAIRTVDSIDVGDGFVTLRYGCDVMHILVDHKEDCHDNTDIGADLDKLTGEDVRLSNFPAGFDWGCETLGYDVSFCRRLEPFMDEINEANGDVCTKMSTRKSKRCLASMRVEEMTGVFKDAMPFLADLVPIEAFEAGYIERDHDVGIVFPCF